MAVHCLQLTHSVCAGKAVFRERRGMWRLGGGSVLSSTGPLNYWGTVGEEDKNG